MLAARLDHRADVQYYEPTRQCALVHNRKIIGAVKTATAGRERLTCVSRLQGELSVPCYSLRNTSSIHMKMISVAMGARVGTG